MKRLTAFFLGIVLCMGMFCNYVAFASGEVLFKTDYSTTVPMPVGANASSAEIIKNGHIKMVDNSWSATGYEFATQTNTNLEVTF